MYYNSVASFRFNTILNDGNNELFLTVALVCKHGI